MKKLLLFICFAFLASCGKEPPEQPQETPMPEPGTELAGMMWSIIKHWDSFDEGGGEEELELTFTSTVADFTSEDRWNGTSIYISFTGTYTYVPPVVTITVTSPEQLAGRILTGTVRDGGLSLNIPTIYDEEEDFYFGEGTMQSR